MYFGCAVEYCLLSEMNTTTRVQIIDKTAYISHSDRNQEKSMNPIFLLPTIGKQ